MEVTETLYQLVVIGAGPAGLCAAATAAGLGLDVLLLDEQSSPGGQIFRGVTNATVQRSELLGKDFRRGEDLVADFEHSGAEYWPETSVWSLDSQRRIGILRDGQASRIRAEHVIM